MPEHHIVGSITGGRGPGAISFTKGPNGRGLVMGSDPIPSAPATPIAPIESPAQDDIPAEATPFQKLYPGVDPAKVDFAWDERTRKVRFVPRAEEAPETQDDGGEGEEPPTPIETPTTPSPTPSNEVAQLRGEIAQMSQVMLAMAQAQMQGKTLGEFLGEQAAGPDYSQYDLYDPDQRAAYHRQLKDELKAEIRAELAPHQQVMASMKQQQEYSTIALKHGKEPDFERKAALTAQLIQGNPNVSFEATYNLVSQIQKSLGVNGTPAKAATPTSGVANKAQQTILTEEQAAAKAAQAAKLPQNSGVRGGGAPSMPENIGFKEAVRWVTHQVALGNIKA